MDRRLFLTGLFAAAGCAAIARPIEALAGIPTGQAGILHKLDEPANLELEDDVAQADIEPVSHRRSHRRRRRRVWRRVCRRVWHRGRRVTRCRRSRVWISIGF